MDYSEDVKSRTNLGEETSDIATPEILKGLDQIVGARARDMNPVTGINA